MEGLGDEYHRELTSPKRLLRTLGIACCVALAASALPARAWAAPAETKQPNIIVLMPDDVGYWNLSAYHNGMMGGCTPNIQSESPGAHKESNWLPAPKAGPFRLTLRFYSPKEEVIKGSWVPPAIVRQK